MQRVRSGLSRLSALPALAVSLGLGLATTSCGGGGESGTTTNPDLVLLGFNQPNVSGVALNQPLVFTFSADIDRNSLTPDTLRVIGAVGPFFEKTWADENFVTLIPRAPNFGDLSDSGLEPDTLYSVSMPVFPAVDTIASTGGKPLLKADTFTFRTLPTPHQFIESRRILEHGPAPSTGIDNRSDDEGCLQNPKNSLYIYPLPKGSSPMPFPQQSNSGPGGKLLCLQNEGRPHVVPEACIPRHDQRAVGTPSGGTQNVGRVSLEALEITFNEQLNPTTIVPYNTGSKFGTNVQLWRVALLDGTALLPPEQIQTNEPSVVQSLESTRVLLSPSGPALQGIYMINLTESIRDLAGNALVVDDDPSLTGQIYQFFDGNYGASVPAGYRIYFQTLQIAGTASAINESFGSSLAEWGDLASGVTEPGVFTQSATPTNPLFPIPGVVPGGMTTPSFTLLYGPGVLQSGQSTTANWAAGFRFLNLPSLEVNSDADSGLGRLKAVWRPHTGRAGDGAFDSNAGLFNPGPGDNVTLTTTPGAGGSANGDGVYEFQSFILRAGDVVNVTGNRPLLILCRGNFEVDGVIELSGGPGRFGLDTDGSADYTNSGAVTPWGVGGTAGPGGGDGGRGAGPIVSPSAFAGIGLNSSDVFGPHPAPLGGGPGPGGAGNAVGGGGGGGFLTAGAQGTKLDTLGAVNGGLAFGTPLFERALAAFTPDRGYFPHADVTGGTGGGGGGARDNNGNNVVDNSDAAGGGGGGGGGAIWVIAGGSVRIGPTGVIRANGGVGGSTYNKANQRINPGSPPDNASFAEGLLFGATPSGQGGPGGGGAGGGVLLIGEGGVNLQAGGQILAQGASGGFSGTSGYNGGTGSDGRIALLDIGGSGVTVSGTALPAPTTGTCRPTTMNGSSGQSQWIDLFTPTVEFNPIVATVPQKPFYTTNFEALVNAGQPIGVGVGPPAGFGNSDSPTGQFNYVIEYQGADSLTPTPETGTPLAATGLTQWNANIDLCDDKRYFRYRWRFFVSNSFPGLGPLALPMPAVLDFTIPFTK